MKQNTTPNPNHALPSSFIGRLIGLTVMLLLCGSPDTFAQAPESFTSSGTWTCPPGVTKVFVECWGAGGGGGSRTSNGRAGGGGGGAYSCSTLTVIPGNSYTITVGTGGSATNDGGPTVFHSNWVKADGGKGAALNSSTGGSAGLGSNCIGSFWFNGGTGANGGSNGGGGGGGAGSRAAGSNGSSQNGGNGGLANGGKGGNGATSNGNGSPGANYGAGGGGAERTTGTRTGGAGANGLLIVSPVLWKNDITGTNPNTANPFMNGDVVESHISVSGISRGSGISGSNANHRYAANGWTTSGSRNSSDYFEFTLSPDPGYAIDLHSFQYTGQISTGSADHSFRSSLNGFSSNIGSPTTTGTTISLSAPAYQGLSSSITFRFYTYDVNSASTVFSINDFIFFGNVYAVPAINNFSPASACAGSGTLVTINGSNFTGATAVRFNGVNASSFTLVNDNQITAVLPPGAGSGLITVVTPNATAGSPSNFTVLPLPSFPAPFTTSSASVCKGQQDVVYTVPLNAGVSYTWTYTGTGASYSSTSNTVSVDFSASATSGTLSVSASNSCGTSSARSIAITVNDIPAASISPDYCTGTGFVKLSASAGTTYLWSTGQTSPFIQVDQAGEYSVNITNAAGCQASTSIQVAQELVINGNFEAGNSGFTTAYTYSATANGLYPEGTYGVNDNANYNHDLFYGKDHTTGSGKFMIINGSPTTGTTVWSQNNITVQPNTTYYFSAWGMSVYNANNAILQFSINGFQVGTIAYLPNGYTNNAGPYNWVRFYGSWNSGPSTNANLSIVNLNTILGGNDFGLDDISFGTLSPTPLAVSPTANSGGSVCSGSALYLSANASGGASPFSYSWTGPNGFTSTLQNPQVSSSASATHNGTYSLTLTDGFGCQVSSSVSVTVNALPNDISATAVDASVCSGTGTSIQLTASQLNVYYQLKNDADDSEIGYTVNGSGGNILLPGGTLTANTTYNILAISTLTGCPRQLSSKPTVSVTTTPVLSISNQAACSGTVDLTAPAVTAGSTGGGSLSYWTDAAASVALPSPTAVGSGKYYIKSSVSGCDDIEPVTVSISSNPVTTFNYSGSPFCTTETNPLPVFTGGGTAGIFSATPSGLSFTSTSTGEINLASSLGGTYSVKNTITPSGGCGTFSSSFSITVTASPVASFQYTSNDICQSADALDPVPVFINGGIAGTFSSSFGLDINSSTGIIDVSESLPGNYAVINTIASSGGCPAVADTVYIDVNPYTFDGSVSASVTTDRICNGESTQLLSSGTSYLSTLLSEKFNGAINNWVTSNNSSGGTVNNASWTLRPDNYNSGTTFSSNDDSQFYLSHSRNQNGTITHTLLRSPQMSTIGYTTLALNFWHYYNFDAKTGESAKVEVSTDGSTWTAVATYTSDQGSSTSFVNPTINLNAYTGQPVFFIRFNYYAGGRARYWAIDNVTLAGNSTNYSYSWSSSPSGFSSTDQNPITSPVTNTFYILTATNTYGCSTPVSPVPVTVKPLPVLSSTLNPPAVCSGSPFNYTASSSSAGATYSWTRPAVSGISNPAISIPQPGSPSETLINTGGSTLTVSYPIQITADGCENTQNVQLSVNPKPLVVPLADMTVCNGTPVQLGASISNAVAPLTYSWAPANSLDDPTIATPTAQPAGASESYTLTLTDGNNCVSVSNPLTVTNQGFGGTPGLWTGAANSDWDNCLNWSDGKIPTSSTDVIINQSSTVDCQINGLAQCNSLQILSDNSNAPDLTLTGSGNLQVSNDITIHKSAGSGFSKLIMTGAAQLACRNLTVTGINSGEGNAAYINEDQISQAYIHGELRLEPGGRIVLTDGNNLTPDAMVHIQGNFTNNALPGDFVGDLSTLIFDGNATQYISCPDGQRIANLVVNNSNPLALVLNSSIQVEQALDLSSGCIDLNGNDLVLGSSSQDAVISGQSTNSYIIGWKGSENGNIIQHTNLTGVDYVFPIGDETEYTPIQVHLNSAMLNNASISVSLRGLAHPEKGTSTTYLNRYWIVEPSGISNPIYEVEYQFAGTDVTGDPASLYPAKYNSGGWQSCQESNANARIGNGSVNASTYTLSWSGINSFSEFSAYGNGSPLPVELLTFQAEPGDGLVSIHWLTATEINNDYFMVQRSSDAHNFTDIEKVNGAGNTSLVKTYQSFDKKPLEGISYYRLKQVDYNGSVSYSAIVSVKFNPDEYLQIEEIHPQPNQQSIRFRLSNPATNQADVVILDAGGRFVYQSRQGQVQKDWQGTLNLGDLPKGVYLISFRMTGKCLTRRFVY